MGIGTEGKTYNERRLYEADRRSYGPGGRAQGRL